MALHELGRDVSVALFKVVSRLEQRAGWRVRLPGRALPAGAIGPWPP